MPIFEYTCKTCNKTEEVITNHPESEEVFCMQCHGKCERVPFAVPGKPIFKGHGFYQTDYVRKNDPKE